MNRTTDSDRFARLFEAMNEARDSLCFTVIVWTIFTCASVSFVVAAFDAYRNANFVRADGYEAVPVMERQP